ncbi:hypothetical protein [Streptomyces huiliensis]|uniref:hypothetical protein n=1 Tax=Streptomyces huiliensis TaxID=2876027 RepID=UPI001CBF506C|nr:hypothetical protein [Streptomyces huiliensis]MBZ4321435.1 hypothetical protein [Streptomyces huiliensis]
MSKKIQAVAGVREAAGWKHLALSGSEYVVFGEAGVQEGPAEIKAKWCFLPERFHADIDAAMVLDREDGGWRYVFVKDNERIVFTDERVEEGPMSVTDFRPYLKGWLEGDEAPLIALGVGSLR